MATILVTNDDGILSPGLKAAVEAVLTLGDVVVVAPSTQQSAMGRSFDGDQKEHLRPIDYTVKGIKVPAYHAACSPARVVLHAFDVLFRDRIPDLLVSGINYGENLGSNVTISGTIGAALQAASHGVKGLAMSLQTETDDYRDHAELDWTTAIHFTRQFARSLLTARLPADVDILSVNIPASATAETPWRISRLSRQPYFSNKLDTPTLASKLCDSEYGHGYDVTTLEPDCDIRTFVSGMVAVTPLSMDLTSRADAGSIQVALDAAPGTGPISKRMEAKHE